jgi:signal transduction histidine kinase
MGEPVTLADTQRLVAPVHVTWLKRALRNLVSNAVRYGGAAEVSLARDNGEAVLRVSDTGPGIPEDRIGAMLEPFARGEASRNRETGGAGLGLTLARAIAEQHGGRLVLANRRGGGLTAEIRLPLTV